MGITKQAVALIGLRIPTEKITRKEEYTQNLCLCDPQTAPAKGKYCPQCGRRTSRPLYRLVLVKHPEIVYLEDDYKDPFFLMSSNEQLTIGGYPVVGRWREDKYLYVCLNKAATEPTYAAENADPARQMLIAVTAEAIGMLRQKMEELGLWEETEFGLWAVMLIH